jgi:polysaccharide deacetylase 2 family uncharacterized protein YibQ
MPKVRWATLLMLAIFATLALLIVLVPRRPTSAARPPSAKEAERPAPGPTEPPAEGELPTISALPKEERPEPAPRPEVEARIAVVVDDVGYNLEGLKAFLAIPFPIAFAVLPNLPHSAEAARLIEAAGRELLLHMPMEALNGENPGPGAILTSQDERQIESILEASFAELPAAVGMNNHMGSKATADQRVMDVVMRYLAARRLFFLDSRTTADTLAPTLAERYGVRLLSRDVFVDNQTDAAYIVKAVRKGVDLARSRGRAVLIGHVQDAELARELTRLLPGLERQGVQLVAPSSLARREAEP